VRILVKKSGLDENMRGMVAVGTFDIEIWDLDFFNK